MKESQLDKEVALMMKASAKRNWQDVLAAINRMKEIARHQKFLTGAEKREWRRLIKSYEMNALGAQEADSREQAVELESRLTTLTGILGKAKNHILTWKDVWDEVSRLNSFFQKTHFADPAHREEAWRRFQKLVDDLKEHEKQDKDQRLKESEALLLVIRTRALEARPTVLREEDSVQIQIAALEDAKIQLQRFSHNLHDTWGLFQTSTDKLSGHHRREAFTTLREVQDHLNVAWRAWLLVWQRLYEVKIEEHRREPRRILQLRLQDLRFMMARSQAHLLALEEMNESADNDDFRRRTQNWIEDERTKIAKLQRQIDAVEFSLRREQE